MPPQDDRIPYALAQFGRADAELARLKLQVDKMLVSELQTYRALGLQQGMSVVDVGSGSGEPARVLLANGHTVTCVDHDETMLAGIEPALTPTLAKASALPFSDGSFDAAYSRLAFQHLSDPADAAKEMTRVVRDGGVVVVADADHDAGAVFPSMDAISRAQEAWNSRSRRLGADPAIGRRLKSLLIGAGLVDVMVDVIPFSSESVGPQVFASILFSPLFLALEPHEIRETEHAIQSWCVDPGAFGLAFLAIASGKKPGAQHG